MANLQKIKDLAQEKRIAMKDLADAVKITPQALSYLIKKNSTNIETLEQIAVVLGVTPSIFFEDCGHNTSSIVGNNNTDNTINSDAVILKALNEISEQRTVTQTAQRQIDKRDAQIDRLLSIIEQNK